MKKQIFSRDSKTCSDKLKDLLANTIPNGDCLEWTRCFNTDGYPRMAGNVKVHRLVYQLNTGEDISNYVIRHTCDNPKCINPKHLIKGSNLDNIQDRCDRGRTFRKMSSEIISSVRYLFSIGKTRKEISQFIGLDIRRVSDILTNKFNDNGSLNRR